MMNPQSNITLGSLAGAQKRMPPMVPVPASAEGPLAPTASDRLYQLAALTAGIFLLATLL